MILHIVQDEKFTKIAIEIFENAYPDGNDYYVITDQKEFNFLKNTKVKRISKLSVLSKKFMKSFHEYDFVVLHLLDDKNKFIVLNSSNDVKFLWLGWGMDYYNYLKTDLHLDKTDKLLNSLPKKSMKSKIKNLFIKIALQGDKTQKLMRRIDYFAPVLENEYELVKQAFDDFKPQFIDWNYGTLEHLLSGYENTRVNGNNILIGNSATPTNNHLEAFEIIEKNINIKLKKVIVPLSYGVEEYKKVILIEGNKLLNKSFMPLDSFMPLNEYVKLISSCSVVVMNHLRQQAIGNINIMLYLGARVFLNKYNPAYDYYKGIGVILNTVDELSDELVSKGLTEQEIKQNQNALKNIWAENHMKMKTQFLINKIKNDV